MLGKLRSISLDKLVHWFIEWQVVIRFFATFCLIYTQVFVRVSLTLRFMKYLFIKTLVSVPLPGGRHELSLLTSRYAAPSGADCGRRRPSSPGCGCRFLVSRQRILRSERPAPLLLKPSKPSH